MRHRLAILTLCLIGAFASESAWANRYYSPESGRFISRDPDWFLDGQSRNFYQYVNSKPTVAFDPKGLLTVYVWEPHADAYGHASMKLCDGTYISWWPAGQGGKKQYNKTGVAGTPNASLDADMEAEAPRGSPPGTKQKPDYTINLGCNCLDEKAILKWWNKYKNRKNPKWAVLTNSCSWVVKTALNIGSSALNPCYASLSHSNTAWTPKDAAAYAQCQERWCKSKKKGKVCATGRYVWENVKEIGGGAIWGTLKGWYYKGEIAKKAAK